MSQWKFYGSQNINACVGEQDMIIPDVQGGGYIIYNWYVDVLLVLIHY